MATTKRSGGRKKTKAAEVLEEQPLSVEATSERDLFVGIARALFEVMVEPPAELAATVAVQINLEGNGWADMVVHWVRELVAAHQQRGYIFKKFVIHEISKHRLSAEAWGEKLPADRLVRRREVRGVPYHKLSVDHDEAAGLWRAQLTVETAGK